MPLLGVCLGGMTLALPPYDPNLSDETIWKVGGRHAYVPKDAVLGYQKKVSGILSDKQMPIK